MGVDCRITLPHTARLRDVADVIGILLGKEAELAPLSRNSIHCKVEGVTTKSSAVVECAEIEIKDALWGHDGHRGDRWFLYHFEFENGYSTDGDYHTESGRGILPRATAINIAMAVELVKFFGGEVDFNDSDAKDVDFKAPTKKDIQACNGEGWEKFQRRMAAVQPLTKAQVAEYQKYAAYK